MRAIEKYIDALVKCDNKALADTFAPEGTLRDYCPNSTGRQEYHVYAKQLTCSLKTSLPSDSISYQMLRL